MICGAAYLVLMMTLTLPRWDYEMQQAVELDGQQQCHGGVFHYVVEHKAPERTLVTVYCAHYDWYSGAGRLGRDSFVVVMSDEAHLP